VRRFKLGFKIGSQMSAWDTEFAWLFELRDAALHHSSSAAPTVPHPVLPTNVSLEVRAYSVEAADRGVRLMLDVFNTCLASPKPELSDLTEWANALRPSVAALLARAKPLVEGLIVGTSVRDLPGLRLHAFPPSPRPPERHGGAVRRLLAPARWPSRSPRALPPTEGLGARALSASGPAAP
jgi:hypothetical protein